MKEIINMLLESSEPSIRYKTRVNVLGEDPSSEAVLLLQKEIRASERICTLLKNRDSSGRLESANNPYKKWYGAHWVLASLADLGYPKDDESLFPIIDFVLDYWLDSSYFYKVPIIEGKARRCASQQGNILFSTLKLFGLKDERVDKLAQLLIKWQWPDGGWNCDKNPKARKSSFWESLIPFRALALYAQLSNRKEAYDACGRAAEVFLSHSMYRKISSGEIMNEEFMQLHYPCYWHYDILFGLKVMAEAGYINDPRCSKALDLLESKQLPNGGWPAEAKYYRVLKTKPTRPVSNIELVSWGVTGKNRMNEWVTADALYVLRASGRLKI